MLYTLYFLKPNNYLLFDFLLSLLSYHENCIRSQYMARHEHGFVVNLKPHDINFICFFLLRLSFHALKRFILLISKSVENLIHIPYFKFYLKITFQQVIQPVSLFFILFYVLKSLIFFRFQRGKIYSLFLLYIFC